MDETKKILLVDDDQYLRDLYSRQLEAIGYSVITATNGQEALELAQREDVQLMLLDVMIPEPTGLEVLTQLRQAEKTKELPIFLLTNLGQEGIMKDAYKVGVSGYFLKTSILPKDVAEHVKKFLESA